MKRGIKQLAAWALALSLALTLLPAAALAAESPPEPEPPIEAPTEEGERQEAPEEAVPEEPPEEPPAVPEEPAGEAFTVEPVWVEEDFPNLDVTGLLGEAAPNGDGWGLWSPRAVDAQNENYQEMKRQLLAGIKARQTEIRVKNLLGDAIKLVRKDATTLTFDASGYSLAWDTYCNTLYDYPEATYFARTGASLSASDFDRSTFVVKELVYMPIYIQADDARYQSAVNAAAKECFTDGMTPLEKVVAAHDWIAVNCQYDPYVGNSKTVVHADGITYGESGVVYTSYGVFVDGNAVCQGYALALKVLLDRAGVECCYVSSTEMGHGWNMVRLDGQWYHVDTTWADGIYSTEAPANSDAKNTDVPGFVYREYFLFTDGEAQDKKHHDWTTEYGCTTASSSYEMPAALSGASATAAYLYGGQFYLLSTDGSVNAYPVGENFSGAVKVADDILNASTRPMSGLFDRTSRTLYYFDRSCVYAVSLDTKTVDQMAVSVPDTCGLKMKTESNGLGTLYLWNGFAPLQKVEGLGMLRTSTTESAPLAVCYFPAAQDIAALSKTPLMLDLGSGGHAGTVYAAVYSTGGKMLRIVALTDFAASQTGKIALDGSKIDTTGAAAAKIMVAQSGSCDPLAAAFTSGNAA